MSRTSLRNGLVLLAGALVLCALVTLVLPRLAQTQQALAAGPGTRLNVTVLCSSCTIPSDSEHGYLILLNPDNGDVWAYRDITKQPVHLGKLSALGSPAVAAK